MEKTINSPRNLPLTADCAVHIYKRGTITVRGRPKLPALTNRPRPKARRSKIKTFSRQSAARLRRRLVQTKGPDGWRLFAASLTVPGPLITDVQWRRVWSVFRQKLRRYGKNTFIWRIELQERGQPHAHCVGWGKYGATRIHEYWLDSLGVLGPYEGPASIDFEGYVRCSDGNHSEFKPGWITCTHRGVWPGAEEHAVDIQSLDGDCTGWWRYIASHTSKSKQAQLGWQGRQWGTVNGRLLDLEEPELIELKGKAADKTVRGLRKVTGCRHASGHGRQSWFDKPETSRRLCEWAEAEARDSRA